ncbi:uncharacterized protein LY89DRAFT_366598 [Mollisia scopiformis]|uniref:Uncharacterized protein n=1 Tax=Mollisia scopiformis TaxID=149040 RepID=A0A132B4T6_MOLSC|nr:uncharacterized protein LY89DRAFT_366598 [Mollisia scopiformis]KUJ07420.1 hypothetical protein LY89DRAFT_366598 [Mollisia scopiformis]
MNSQASSSSGTMSAASSFEIPTTDPALSTAPTVLSVSSTVTANDVFDAIPSVNPSYLTPIAKSSTDSTYSTGPNPQYGNYHVQQYSNAVVAVRMTSALNTSTLDELESQISILTRERDEMCSTPHQSLDLQLSRPLLLYHTLQPRINIWIPGSAKQLLRSETLLEPLALLQFPTLLDPTDFDLTVPPYLSFTDPTQDNVGVCNNGKGSCQNLRTKKTARGFQVLCVPCKAQRTSAPGKTGGKALKPTEKVVTAVETEEEKQQKKRDVLDKRAQKATTVARDTDIGTQLAAMSGRS